ncbi:MAG TPA: PssD/Cps14F family polysaccharide biosynthesis glycosyltransferase [Thermodesulfobacteriota bacterium]|nr:PssD/Cps14F family polysaccharide biosynthesis glycosyltransferase [Thermodesulfobacteriota bacterium]
MKRNQKIGLICSHGGHFVELLQVREAFDGYPAFLLTYKEVSTLNQKNAYYIANIGKNPVAFIFGVFKIFFILLKERPTVLFSTGSEIAIPPFYFGKFLFGTKLIYLESCAQIFRPSMTGKWVYPITDLFLVQWEPLLKEYGSKAKYVGGLV